MNINGCFARLVNRIQPSETEKLSAQQHLYTVRTGLAATFNVRRPLVTGSYARNSFIRGGSDVDLFAVISKKDCTHGGSLVKSTTVLSNVRDQLSQRYPTTPVTTDENAVAVSFSSGISVDVVPAIFDSWISGQSPLYLIPDGDGWWMASCPDLHNKYIRTADEKSTGKLKRVAQLLKHWCNSRTARIPISSFHIEMLLAAEGICIGPKSYAACVTEALQLLAERGCRGMQDPLQISGLIPATKTEAQRESALAAVRNSREHAKDACWFDYAGKTDDAWQQWNYVFNYTFPK
jgi:predicted nucleotidyltransferase